MNRTTKIILTVVVAGCLVALVAFTLTNNKKEVEAKVYHPDVNTAVVVQVDTVKTTAFEQSTSFTGSFSPNREVTIGSETSGKVIKVNVQEGDFVKSGSLIAQLDNGLLQAQLHSAQASYDKAAGTLARYEQAPSGVTTLQMDNAKTDILTTNAQIEQLRKQISQYTILAPFSGIVTSRNFDLGAIVSPGAQMATLTDISALKLEINVPEKNISQFHNGQAINVTSDVYPGTSFTGKVDMVAAKADAAHNFTVKILVSNSKSTLKSGMYGSVVLDHHVSASALTIPRSALIGSSIKPQVYVLEDGVAKLTDIELGSGNETRIEVIQGLKPGELVVSGGLVNLSNGSKVTVGK